MTVGFLAGACNALVGGGTLFTFPVLLAAGLAPVTANTTTTVALVPGTFTSAYAYLPELAKVQENLPRRMAVGSVARSRGGILARVWPSAFRMKSCVSSSRRRARCFPSITL